MRAWTEWAECPASTDSRNVSGWLAGGEAGSVSLVYRSSAIGRCNQRLVISLSAMCTEWTGGRGTARRTE
jgi:hypothetical protein